MNLKFVLGRECLSELGLHQRLGHMGTGPRFKLLSERPENSLTQNYGQELSSKADYNNLEVSW